nr:MAG: hypothetical protein [Apis mellifera filamentous virus]
MKEAKFLATSNSRRYARWSSLIAMNRPMSFNLLRMRNTCRATDWKQLAAIAVKLAARVASSTIGYSSSSRASSKRRESTCRKHCFHASKYSAFAVRRATLDVVLDVSPD